MYVFDHPSVTVYHGAIGQIRRSPGVAICRCATAIAVLFCCGGSPAALLNIPQVYQNISDIRLVDLAITSVCNATCMDCARWWQHQGRIFHNPLDTHRNHHWPWRDLCGHLSVLTHVDRVIICGNAGDPMSHPNIVEACQWMCQRWSDVWIEIDTNGSLGKDDTYRGLADLGGRVTFRFAVDGLADTNHIYRRGVPWHRVEHNILLWHSLGGDAVLKTIDFPWNQHQRADIKAWALGMGWQHRVDPRWSPDWDHLIISHPEDKPRAWRWRITEHQEWKPSVEKQILDWISRGRPMRPECKSHGDWLYINHDHRVWPCCYWANSSYVEWLVQKKHLEHVQRVAHPDWNCLDHRPLTEIIRHPIFQGIERLWQGSDVDSTSSLCMHNCGGCTSDE